MPRFLPENYIDHDTYRLPRPYHTVIIIYFIFSPRGTNIDIQRINSTTKEKTMKKLLFASILFGSAFLSLSPAYSSDYGRILSEQISVVQNHTSNAEYAELQGVSNDALRAARYRSGLRADIAHNRASAQHAELGVVDHRLDTARRAQKYDHYAHMDKNRETRDDFYTVHSAARSVSGTVGAVNNTVRGLERLFK